MSMLGSTPFMIPIKAEHEIALCEHFFRRRKRCQRRGRFVDDLGMALCQEHEENERKLRAVGFDSRQDERYVRNQLADRDARLAQLIQTLIVISTDLEKIAPQVEHTFGSGPWDARQRARELASLARAAVAGAGKEQAGLNQ